MAARKPTIDPVAATHAANPAAAPARASGVSPPAPGASEATKPARKGAAALAETVTSDRAVGASGGSRATEDEALVGARLAHFQVERLLGKGGMGEVYLATDLALDRPVALKFLPRAIAEDERLRERFYREARAQARVQHPNVGHIYFIGEQDGQIFFAMEFIDGESFQDKLDREGKLSPGEAVEYCRMAALGLAEAHRHGFIHRDVKPSNLMVDRHGTVKVLDFGIAKQTSGDAAPPALTHEGGGGLIGTPLTMSPEQAKGEAVDFRSDIYALGATLHYLIAGTPPFVGDTAMGIVAKHLAEPRPQLNPSRRRRSQLDELCDRMMAKKPADRFASYEELIAAMERASPSRHRPAGFWVRSFALGIDTLIAALAAALLVLPLALLGFERGNTIFGACFAVYCIVGQARWGRTLGKLALELEVCRAGDGKKISASQAALRFLSQWGIVYVAAGLMVASRWIMGEAHIVTKVLGLVVAGALLFPLGAGAYMAWTNPAKRTFWDRVSGTEVRYARPRER
jgi:uncharacterized RDD family membrane protein YckC/predicted Ser/Thr protein kinase